MREVRRSRRGRGGFCLSGLAAILMGIVAVIPTVVKKPIPGPTTKPGSWVQVQEGVEVRAYLGFWRDNDANPNVHERPGDAAKVVRLVKDKPEDTHFGVTLVFKDPDYSGSLSYRETVTLPAKPRTWDELNESLRWLHVDRQLSADGKTSTMTEQMEFASGDRLLPSGDIAVNVPTPFVLYDFDAGDPAGKWVIQCWVNDVRVGHFEFEVVKGKDGERDVVVVGDEAMQKLRPRDLGRMSLPADQQSDAKAANDADDPNDESNPPKPATREPVKRVPAARPRR